MFEAVCVLCISSASAQHRRYTEWIIRSWPGQVSIILPIAAVFLHVAVKSDFIGEKNANS